MVACYIGPKIPMRTRLLKTDLTRQNITMFLKGSSDAQRTANQAPKERKYWGYEGETAVFCYDCHEELLHNPVLLPEDIKRLADIVQSRGFAEDKKTESREKIAGRIMLFREVIKRGLEQIEKERSQRGAGEGSGKAVPFLSVSI